MRPVEPRIDIICLADGKVEPTIPAEGFEFNAMPRWLSVNQNQAGAACDSSSPAARVSLCMDTDSLESPLPSRASISEISLVIVMDLQIGGLICSRA